MSIRTQAFSAREIGAALAIGSVALVMLGLQPILLGELVDRHLITLEGVGLVAMGEILTLGIGVALSDALLPVSHYRLAIIVAAVAASAIDMAMLYAAVDTHFIALRAIAGLAEGVLLWAATNVIIRTATPDRLIAIFMVVQTLFQAGVALLLSDIVMPRASWPGGFVVLGIASTLCVGLAMLLPLSLPKLNEVKTDALKWSAATILPLLIAFLQMAALGSLWAYMEPIGEGIGLDTQGAQRIASEVLSMQVVGGLAAVWLIPRLGILATLGCGAALLAAIVGSILVLSPESTMEFTLLSAAFGFVWLFLMPFHVGLALRADSKGRVAVLIPAAQLVGSAIGPFVASLAVSGDNVDPVPLVSVGFALASLLVILVGRKLWSSARVEHSFIIRDKVVLIAGASSGMGRALALRLAGDGASVIVTARRQAQLDALASEIQARGGRCLALAADGEDPAAAEAVVTACIDTFGHIDLAILNIGGAPALDMRKMTSREVTAYMRSNYDTVVNYLFPILHQMTRQRYGTVVHTNSLAGFLGVPLQGPYSAAKGALRLLFDTCRIEFGEYGIRFVSVYPGFVATSATANDGMPAPLEISEATAVDHILRAIRQCRSDYLFPFSMNLLIRLASILPKAVTTAILRKTLPPMETKSADVPSASQ